MSGADDQRGAEPEIDWKAAYEGVVGKAARLEHVERELAETWVELVAVREERGKYGKGWRAAQVELAETRDRRDYLQGQLDIIYDAEYSRNDALKRRIEKMGTAGDALAGEVTAMLTGPVPDSGDWWSRLAPLVDAWRSGRGDAPTQPPAAGVSVPQKSTESPDGDQ